MSKAKKRIKYGAIQHNNLEGLVKQINLLLEQGYCTTGGISTVVSIRDQSQIIYTQAFTKEGDENEKNKFNK